MSRPVAIGKTPISANDTHPYRQDHSVIYFLKSSLAGGVSGCFAKTVVAPLDRVKILFQGSRPDYVKHAGKFDLSCLVNFLIRHFFRCIQCAETDIRNTRDHGMVSGT